METVETNKTIETIKKKNQTVENNKTVKNNNKRKPIKTNRSHAEARAPHKLALVMVLSASFHRMWLDASSLIPTGNLADKFLLGKYWRHPEYGYDVCAHVSPGRCVEVREHRQVSVLTFHVVESSSLCCLPLHKPG